MRTWFHIAAAAIFVALIMGCSTSNKSAVLPGLSPSTPTQLTGAADQNKSGGQSILWGYWNIAIDPQTQTVEIVPLRGVQWTVDVVKFLQPPIGKAGAIDVKIVDIGEWHTLGHLPVDIGLTHPFPGMNQFTGSDVRGVFITTGHNTLGQDTALKYTDMGVNDPYLANADGYTRWMNPVEFSEDGKMWTFKPGAKGVGTDFDGTLNGYKYFASGLGATDDLYDFFSNPANLHNRGEFLAGAKNTRRYDLYFPMTGVGGTPLIKFQYAVVASWKPAGSIDPGDLPGSFPPDANQQECFMLSVADNSTLYYTPSVAGGDLKLQLEIFNWAPHLGASSTVLSDIDKIVIESPQGILPTPYVEIDAASLAPTAMPGTTDASSIVGIDIAGCTPKDVMGQQAIITIRQAGKGYDNDGMGTNYPGVSLAAYFFHALEVSIIGPQNDKVKVTSIDPDHGIPDTHMYDVVVTGENFGGVTELKLVGDTGETTAINLTVTDSKHLACELDFSGLAVGLYDVVAHDPIVGDGVLPDGFKLMDCPGGIQNTLTLYSTNVAYDPLFVAGVFTSGAYAGQIITQQNANAWNRIDVAVPPTDDTPVYYFADKPSLDPYTTDWSWSLDCDPLHEIFAFTTFDDDTNTTDQWPNTEFDFVKVCNQSDGSYLGACDTNAGYIVAQVDVDERGNIWSIDANDYPWSEGGYDNHYTIERWNYDASAPAPYYTKAGEWDISDVIGPDACISDILVLQRYRRLYVSCSSQTADWGVEIHSWDISQDPPVHLNDAFETATGFYGTDSFQEAHQRFVDMEVDRSDDVLAGCRLLVMFMGQPVQPGPRTLELRKMDLDLNEIASSAMEFNWEWDADGFHYQGWFSNFVLDDQHSDRVVATYDRFNNPAPQGIIGVTDQPTDW